MQILQSIVKMNHELKADGETEPHPEMLDKVLEKVLRLAWHDHLICIVSDFNGVNENTRNLVTRLAAHNDVLVVFVHDPLESSLPDAGRLIVSQWDLQLEVDTRDPLLRERFADEFNTRLKKARDLMLKRAVPVIQILTTREVPEQFRELLGHSAART
jgi:hypothetical protein